MTYTPRIAVMTGRLRFTDYFRYRRHLKMLKAGLIPPIHPKPEDVMQPHTLSLFARPNLRNLGETVCIGRKNSVSFLATGDDSKGDATYSCVMTNLTEKARSAIVIAALRVENFVVDRFCFHQQTRPRGRS